MAHIWQGLQSGAWLTAARTRGLRALRQFSQALMRRLLEPSKAFLNLLPAPLD